ncbi:IS110 family transposase [Arenibacter sp. 6A1]|nr:IS110 family transposase [Arenibacter sp. 6A1]
MISDVKGGSASKIINDIIDGKDNVAHLLTHVHGRVQAPREEMAKALTGRITPHHRFMLKMIRESIVENEKLIAKLDSQIDFTAAQYQVELDLLQTIDGVGKDTALAIVSEIGVDMERFPNQHHLASWSGVSPGSNESAGKKKTPESSTGTSTSSPH